MVVIGERRELCKALAKGPLTSGELVGKTRTDERYVRECLGAQAGEDNRRQAVSTPDSAAFAELHKHSLTLFTRHVRKRVRTLEGCSQGSPRMLLYLAAARVNLGERGLEYTLKHHDYL